MPRLALKKIGGPYGAMAHIKVAIVNEDGETTVLGKELNRGNEVVEALRHSNKLGLLFKEPLEGLNHR